MSTNPMPAALRSIIDLHREMFGGYQMMADESAPDAKPAGEQKPQDTPKDGAKSTEDKPLGPNGEKALQQERQARQELERQVKELAPLKAQMDAIAAAFGGDQRGAKPEDAVAALATELGTLKGDLEVERLARANGISDERDIDLLRKTHPDARSDLAARLKPTAAPNQPGGAKPDPSVGKGGGDTKANTSSVSAGRDLYHERRKKTQTQSS